MSSLHDSIKKQVYESLSNFDNLKIGKTYKGIIRDKNEIFKNSEYRDIIKDYDSILKDYEKFDDGLLFVFFNKKSKKYFDFTLLESFYYNNKHVAIATNSYFSGEVLTVIDNDYDNCFVTLISW